MKQLILFLLLILPASVVAQVDDIYFIPKKKKAKVETAEQSEDRVISEQYAESGPDIVNERDEDEYNRRSGSYNREYVADDNDTEEEEYDYSSDDDVTYTYSSRIVRFHSPRKVLVSSPWYWDVVYLGGADNWVIYDDGVYWDLYPSYSYYSVWSAPRYSWWGLGCSYGHWGFYGGYYPAYWHHHHHYYSWGHHHHHYNPWYGWNGAFHYPGYGGGFRDGNRRVPVSNLRAGTVSGGRTGRTVSSLRSNQTDSDRRGSAVRSNRTDSDRRGSAVRSNRTDSDRRGSAVRSNRTDSDRRGSAVRSNRTDSDRRGSAVRSNQTDNNKRGSAVRSNSKSDNSNRSSSVRRSSSSESNTYNRPSSTRSNSRSSNSSSFERSSSSRSSGGGVRSSGGSRGGGRR